MPKLEASGLNFAYRDVEVLRQVELRVEAGEVVGLVGPNGSGKTTLLRCLAGLLRCAGRVSYDGDTVTELSPRQRAQRRAYVPQQVSSAFPYRVADVVAMGQAFTSRFYGAPLAGAGVQQVLDEVAFEPTPDRRFDKLSGGERQQVVVARALVQGAGILLLDEPTSALDLRHRAAIIASLRRRARDGAAVLLSLHDLNLAAVACDRLVLLDHGSISADGTPAEVVRREVLEPVYGVELLCEAREHGGAPRVELHPEALG